MLWMLKDKSFFLKVVDVLRSRGLYYSDIWQYCIYHKCDERALTEYINISCQHFFNLGTFFQSKLVKEVPQKKEFKHLDYYPMLNSRVHLFGDQSSQWSLNKTFKTTYERFLKSMIEKKQITVSDKLQLAYYIQLQDRVNEAI